MSISILTPGIMGARGNPASTILFETDFTDTTLAGYTATGSSKNAFNNITGANNGYTWPHIGGGSLQLLQALTTYVQLIHNYDNLSLANVPNYGACTITPVTDLPGYAGNALNLSVFDSGYLNHGINEEFGAQNDFIFIRVTDGTSPLPDDLTNLYTCCYIKYPSTLRTALLALGGGSRGRAITWEFKTGGYAGLYGGDFRINLALERAGDGTFFWNTHADKNSNGTMTSDAALSAKWIATDPYWSVDNTLVPVLWDTWMKIEVFMHRHATSGRLKVAVNDGVICNYTGRTLGEYGLPVGRFMPIIGYSAAGVTSVSACDLEIRDFPPPGSVLLPV